MLGDDGAAPYYTAVMSSPDDGELSDDSGDERGKGKRRERVTAGAADSGLAAAPPSASSSAKKPSSLPSSTSQTQLAPATMEDAERELRRKLLASQAARVASSSGRKSTSTHGHDEGGGGDSAGEEEMFAVQPNEQEKKKQHSSSRRVQKQEEDRGSRKRKSKSAEGEETGAVGGDRASSSRHKSRGDLSSNPGVAERKSRHGEEEEGGMRSRGVKRASGDSDKRMARADRSPVSSSSTKSHAISPISSSMKSGASSRESSTSRLLEHRLGRVETMHKTSSSTVIASTVRVTQKATSVVQAKTMEKSSSMKSASSASAIASHSSRDDLGGHHKRRPSDATSPSSSRKTAHSIAKAGGESRSSRDRRSSPPSESTQQRIVKMQVEETIETVEIVGKDAMEADDNAKKDVADVSGDDHSPSSQSNASDNETSRGATAVKYSKFDDSSEDEGHHADGTSSPRAKKTRREAIAMAKKGDVLVTEIADDEDSDVMLDDDEDSDAMLDEDVGSEGGQIDERLELPPSPETLRRLHEAEQRRLIARLPVFYPGIGGCRSVEEFQCLNRIEEGTYGVVYRAKEKRTDEVVALKRLKMEKEKDGFPITSLREVNMLLKSGGHENIVHVKEIVVGSNMDKIYLVMEYVEHDMKSLMEALASRGKNFTIGETKTLLRQLLAGVNHMHNLWILHRDLKTSNLLLSHRGVLKIGDFGLAREYGDPLKPYTPIVVTLWYRAPELLLGEKLYSTAIDLWSVGCIFAEFLKLKPLFPGKGELDAINKIFFELGTPSDLIWPGYSDLPGPQKMAFANHPFNQLRKKFGANVLNETGFQLLNKFLTYNPKKRITAEDAMAHAWFAEDPKPTPPAMFPTWPAKSELSRVPQRSPKTAQAIGVGIREPMKPENSHLLSGLQISAEQANKGFSLKFDAPKFK